MLVRQASDNRGAAVAEVQLMEGGLSRVHGVLQTGSAIEYSVSPRGVSPAGDSELVGRMEAAPLEKHRFVKAWLRDDAKVRCPRCLGVARSKAGEC